MVIKRNLRTFSILLIVAMLLTMSACTKNEAPKNIEECCQIRTNSDLTYSYDITNLKGKVIYSESSVLTAPAVKPLSSSVLEVPVQAGIGLATNRAVFCDLKNSIVSEVFHYVLGATDRYVLYVQYEDQVNRIICQNIFDFKALMQEFRIDDPLVVWNSFSEADFSTDGVATISYLTGDTAVQQEYLHIYLPD